MRTIAIGCDPNAADQKKMVIAYLEELGHKVTDLGSDDPVYANTAISVSEKVAAGEFERGILLCGTGIGMSIAANKVKGAYAALVSDAYSAERAIKSNNSNILCLGAFTTGIEVMKVLVKTWMDSEFSWGTRSEEKVRRYMDYDKANK